jgi:hypothetical protein
MPNIDQIIDAKIQQLTELKRMGKDPQMLALMREMVGGANGEHHNAAPQTNGHTGEQKEERSTAPNGLAVATLEGVRTIGKNFSLAELAEYMKKSGFAFVSEYPRVAVGPPIERLIKKELVRLVKRGKGNQPSIYAYTQKDIT